MSNTSSIIRAGSAFVQQYLLEKLPASRLYHNFDHAEEVAGVAKKLAKAADLTDEQSEVLQLAAWFLNCGLGRSEELAGEESAAVAEHFLKSRNYDAYRVKIVRSLIVRFHSDEPPADEMGRILYDANWSFTGRKRFFRRARLLRLEREETAGKKMSAHEWNKTLLDMVIHHPFLTSWAQDRFGKRRNKNLAVQRQNLRKAYVKTIRKRTGKDFGRGVDTLYRVTLRNHIDLSNIADGKANMIISINTLVLSILITAASAGFSLSQVTLRANLQYVLPVVVLMVSSLTAIIFAVFSAMPAIPDKNFNQEDVRQHKVSMLFFGNFLKLKKMEFVKHLRALKKDQELLYDDLSKDLYNLGEVLRTKYRLLTIAYRVFVGGLILTFLAFVSSGLIYSNPF